MRTWRSQFRLLVICMIAACDSDSAPVHDASMSPLDGAVCRPCGNNCFDCGGFGCVCGERDSGSGTNPNNPWISPFPNMGAPGFRTSTDTLCADLGVDSNSGTDVWSDNRGVFALVTGWDAHSQDLDAGMCRQNECTIERLFHNSGTGWQLQTEHVAFDSEEDVTTTVSLRGVVDGPLYMHRTGTGAVPAGFCGLASFDAGVHRCMLETTGVSSLFVVNSTLAYALQGSGNVTRLLRFDGNGWNDDLEIVGLPSKALWADASQVLVVDTSDPFRVLQTPDGVQWNGLGGPATGRGTAIWANSADDVWVGTDTGTIFHFDGLAWQQMGTLGGVTCEFVTPIQGIWGTGESVYFYSAASLQRWNGTSFDSLANWTCSSAGRRTMIRDVWGNSENKIFLALEDGSATDTCGGSIVVRFDGTQFHRM